MAKKRYGLKAVKMGAVEADGGFSTSLLQVGATVSDSAVFTVEKPADTEFSIEESDEPFLVVSKAGKKTVAFSTYDTDVATCMRLFGGTQTTDTDGNAIWQAPDSIPALEMSLELEMVKGGLLRITRAKISASIVWNFGKTKLPQIDIEATILIPEKNGEKTFTFNEKAVDGAVAPSITTQPASDTLEDGDNLIVSVVATGTAPLSYQWKKDGTNIPGATSAMYAKANVASGDAGSYTCVVTNQKGSVTSTAATITVS